MPLRGAPSAGDVLGNLDAVIDVLTRISIQSVAQIVPDSDQEDLQMLKAEHYKDVTKACRQLRLEDGSLNPQFNKRYGPGEGATYWRGALNDGRRRGGFPYYCPDGWARFSLDVIKMQRSENASLNGNTPDSDSDYHSDHRNFDDKYGNWAIMYHGTKGKLVGSILSSGFRAHDGCFCGTRIRILL